MPIFYIIPMKKFLYITLMLTVISGSYASEKETILEIHNNCYSLLDTNLDSAILLANKAEGLSEQEEEYFLQAQSLFIKAYALRMKDDQGKAFIANLKALDILENLSDEKSINLSLNLLINTGDILINHYAYPEAVQYLNEGILLAEQHNIQNKLLLLLYNKGMALRYSGRYDEALIIFNQTLTLANELNDGLRILRSLNQKGLTLKDLKKYDDARATHMKMLEFKFSDEPINKYKGQAWHNIGLSYVEEGKPEKAILPYLEAISHKEQDNNPSELFITYLDLSETYLKIGDLEEAKRYAQTCAPLYEQIPLSPDNYKFFNLMSEIAHQRNDSEGVRTYAQKYFDENEKFLEQQREILEVKDRYKMEVLTAGFFSELEANKNMSLMERVLWLLACGFMVFILASRLYSWNKKRLLTLHISRIKDEGIV